MKKILKLCTILLFFITLSFFYNNSQAKDIQIHATSWNKGISFQTQVGAYTGSVEAWGNAGHPFDGSYISYYYASRSYAKEHGTNLRDSGHFPSGTIASYSYVIHNKPFSTYSNGSTYGYVNNYNRATNLFTSVNSSQSGVNYIEFARLSSGYSIVKRTGSNGQTYDVNIQYNYFPEVYLKNIKENLDKYRYLDNDNTGEYAFYLSEPIAWRFPEGGYIDNIRYVHEEDGKTYSRYVGLLTAAECNNYSDLMGYQNAYDNLPSVFGLSGLNGEGTASYLNQYDNKLFIPKNVLGDPDKVYVRHVDKDGNDLGYNDVQLLISGGNSSRIGNNYNKAIKDTNGVYKEYYEVSAGQRLRVSRLLNIVKDGKEYELVEGRRSINTSYDSAVNGLKNARPYVANTFDVDSTNSGKVTVITFTYDVKDIETDDPGSGVVTLNSKDETENCQMAYTPTKANIKPYLIADKFKLYNLKFNISNDGKYTIDKCEVDKLVWGEIADNEGELGKIFGGENDRETLLLGSSKDTFPVNENSVNSTINSIVNGWHNKDSLPTQAQIDSVIKDTNNKTKKEDFTKEFEVPENRYNGLRTPKLGAVYQRYDVHNSKWINTSYVDYTSNRSYVLVYNPLKVEKPTVKSEGVIDHSTTESNTSVIQKNANFELTLKDISGPVYNGQRNYSDYLSRYYLIFDFDIVRNSDTEYVKLYSTGDNSLNEINVNVGDTIPRGTLIELSKDAKSFKAKAGASTNTGDNISQDVSKITLIGVSNNMPDNVLLRDVLTSQKLNTLGYISENDTKYIGKGTNSSYKINGSDYTVEIDYCGFDDKEYQKRKVHDSSYYNDKTMYGDAYYFVKAENTVTNIGRIYDFKVTDCSDVDYKEVFRKSNTGTINDLTKIQYFSGIKELKIYSSDVNELGNRENISIANNSVASKTILPLGPYKNTNTSYVNAPKMGYRISFDLKTSGYYQYTEKNHSERRIQIKPSYYYISKDGTKYNESIDLYYKDSNGKYVKFEGSNYTIYFKPNDGYRNILNSNITNNTHTMSDKLEPLQIGSKDGFVLNYKMMNTSDNFFIQSWYGEFKLPNSTIAVNKNGSITNPLTNGYVGVRFDITCIEKDSNNPSNDKKLSYNQDNKNANPKTNTTQWDYEGYLGFSNPGQAAKDLSIQLEKGTWNIKDQEEYKKIKSTVVFFDLDNRAANDFD